MSYWETPPDIPPSWVHAKGTLENFTKEAKGKCVTITAVINNATLVGLGSGSVMDVEPSTAERGRGWWMFIRRLISVASLELKEGRGVIVSQVFLNSFGHPSQWTHPQATRIEPKK